MGRHRTFNLQGYGQFLVTSQTNYTQTYLAQHLENISHDSINRWLSEADLSPSCLWHAVKDEVIFSEKGEIIFDDTVLNKEYSHKIDLVCRHYSGNSHKVIKGIPVVTCVYYNPEVDKYWPLTFRIYDIANDKKTKVDHVIDMITELVIEKKILCRLFLMDTWYATTSIMQHIHKIKKIFYCPMKCNRTIIIDGNKYRADKLEWNEKNLSEGILCNLKGLHKSVFLRAFQVERSTTLKEVVVTNDIAQSTSTVAQLMMSHRWNIEQFHREIKQLTGIELCQCRKKKCQRNHIAVCMLVWVNLNRAAQKIGQTLYQIKEKMLENYMKTQLNNPDVRFA
jgi:Transposase DDE domain